MSLFSLVGISSAIAATGTAAAHHSTEGSLLSMLPMLIVFVAVFYFLLVRPQQKRTKDHKKLMDSVSAGDEVVTTGGIVGTVKVLHDKFVTLNIAEGLEIVLQRGSIASVLPKGTLESI